MFLANKKIDNQVKTFITYNKGRDWSLLQAPNTDLRGNPVHCLLVSIEGGAWVVATSQKDPFQQSNPRRGQQCISWSEYCILKVEYIRFGLPGGIARAGIVI